MQEFVRKLQRLGRYSYAIVLPKDIIDELRWQERQKLSISFNKKTREITIRDWEPKSKKK